MKPLRLLHTLASGAAISLCMANARAETQSSNFDVQITLNTPKVQGICTNQLQSQATNALVKVVCGAGQFVSIEAVPDRPFLGTHGGAHRFSFGSSSAMRLELTSGINGYIGAGVGSGTVTALQVLNLNYLDGPLEMLVSF